MKSVFIERRVWRDALHKRFSGESLPNTLKYSLNSRE